MCLQFQGLKLSAKNRILAMFIVLPGDPITKIYQMLVCTSKTGLSIQDWCAIEICKLRMPCNSKKGTRVKLIK